MNDQKKQTPAPAGYSRVCPYLMVADIGKSLLFLTEVMEGEVTEKLTAADGSIRHAEIQIGDCTIMLGKAQPGYPTESMTYVFVWDVDAVFEKALQNGAVSIMKPDNRFYGYREGGFKDPSGHQWWIAQVVKNVSKEEMERLAVNGFNSQS
jgi:PhnB protein